MSSELYAIKIVKTHIEKIGFLVQINTVRYKIKINTVKNVVLLKFDGLEMHLKKILKLKKKGVPFKRGADSLFGRKEGRGALF
jgi:hypothetical protein